MLTNAEVIEAAREWAGEGNGVRDEAIRLLCRRLESADLAARRYYHADGSFEVLDSAEAVVERRVATAKRIRELESACEDAYRMLRSTEWQGTERYASVKLAIGKDVV